MTNEDSQERIRANALAAIKATDWQLKDALIEFEAREVWSKFRALKAQGFSEGEALYLCTQKWNK